MTPRHQPGRSTAALLGLAGCLAAAAATAATLQLESGPTLEAWSPLPLVPGQVTPDGRLIVGSEAAAGFLRLRIDRQGGPVIPLAEVPAAARQLAEEFLDREAAARAGGRVEGDGSFDPGAVPQLGPVAALYHDPAVDDGRSPAYVEFKLVRSAAPRSPLAGAVFRGTPSEADPRTDAGYLVVSLTRGDLPYAGYSLQGTPRFERLLARSRQGVPARLLRFDDAFAVAEDASGRLLASLGSAPYLPDPALLEIPADGYEIDADGKLPGAVGPRLTARSPESYGAFRQEWKSNPVYQHIRAARAAVAAEAWELVGGGLKTLTINPRESVVLNPNGPAGFRAESSAPGIVQVEVDAASGQVRATALGPGDAVVTLWQPDGSSTRCVVETPFAASGPGAAVNRHQSYIHGKQPGWDLIGELFVSNWAEQPKYDQIEDHPQLCPTTVCGCGPTAWAMFFAYWDRRGVERAFGAFDKIDAPETMGNPLRQSVLDATRAAFVSVEEICIPGMDRAATLPGSMHQGLQWCDTRGIGRSGKIKWGVPYLSPGSQSRAIDSLQAGRPSIVGIGFYSHYPIAYGYRRWDWKTRWGTRIRTTYDLRLNLGWGPDHSPEWRNIEQLWYATNLALQ